LLGSLVGHANHVRFRAAAALSSADPGEATAGLRGQLETMASASGATPHWRTLAVEGPRQIRGLRGPEWFEWSATVAVDGGFDLTEETPLGAEHECWAAAITETAPHRLWHGAA
jgi:hypothetical protein